MADGVRRRPAQGCRLATAAALLGLALVGCTDQTKIHEGELTALLAVLPGHYDNSAQAEQDARSGKRPAHDAVALVILHVYTPRLGHYVYFAQESAADDPRRVFTQKMYSFQVDDKKGIVETLYEFVEPQRWRDGLQNKDVFTSIMSDDVRAEGCQLFWKKTTDGFVANHDPKICPDAPGEAATPQVEFVAGALTIGDYKFRRAR
jgi:CpeT/CpcT family protein DUF1001